MSLFSYTELKGLSAYEQFLTYRISYRTNRTLLYVKVDPKMGV